MTVDGSGHGSSSGVIDSTSQSPTPAMCILCPIRRLHPRTYPYTETVRSQVRCVRIVSVGVSSSSLSTTMYECVVRHESGRNFATEM